MIDFHREEFLSIHRYLLMLMLVLDRWLDNFELTMSMKNSFLTTINDRVLFDMFQKSSIRTHIQ